MSIAEKLETAAENVQKVYEAGKRSEYDLFWDDFQKNGTRTNYHTAFARAWKNNTTYRPKYPITCDGNNSATSMFSYSGVTDTLVDISASGNNNGLFYGSNLITIRKLIVDENLPNMANWFDQCASLRNITFEGCVAVSVDLHWSGKLTAESMVSLVEHLSDSVSGKTVLLSTTAVNNADWSATAYDGFDALVAMKPNWTITLS